MIERLNNLLANLPPGHNARSIVHELVLKAHGLFLTHIIFREAKEKRLGDILRCSLNVNYDTLVEDVKRVLAGLDAFDENELRRKAKERLTELVKRKVDESSVECRLSDAVRKVLEAAVIEKLDEDTLRGLKMLMDKGLVKLVVLPSGVPSIFYYLDYYRSNGTSRKVKYDIGKLKEIVNALEKLSRREHGEVIERRVRDIASDVKKLADTLGELESVGGVGPNAYIRVVMRSNRYFYELEDRDNNVHLGPINNGYSFEGVVAEVSAYLTRLTSLRGEEAQKIAECIVKRAAAMHGRIKLVKLLKECARLTRYNVAAANAAR